MEQVVQISLDNEVEPGLLASVKTIEGPYADTLELARKVNDVKVFLYSKGYLFSESRVQFDDSLTILQVKTGPLITQAEPQLNLPSGFAIPELADAPLRNFSPTKDNLKKVADYYLTYFENHGHPFASLQFEDYRIENDTLKGNLSIVPGPKVILDSLVIKGFDRFSKNVIRYDLGYRKGMLYSEQFLKGPAL